MRVIHEIIFNGGVRLVVYFTTVSVKRTYDISSRPWSVGLDFTVFVDFYSLQVSETRTCAGVRMSVRVYVICRTMTSDGRMTGDGRGKKGTRVRSVIHTVRYIFYPRSSEKTREARQKPREP